MVNSPLIWIVEDDRSTQRLIAEHLKAHGFRPAVFDTAEKAYASLQACEITEEKAQSDGGSKATAGARLELPALIILDMLLPGMSGVDLIRLLKQNSSWEKIPVVVVTVLSRQESLGSLADSSKAFWVNKPFDANNLIQTVQDVLVSVGLGGQ